MKKPKGGLVMTIASDDEVEPEEETDSESELAANGAAAKPVPLTKAGKKRQRQKAAAAGKKGEKGDGLVDPTFSFDVDSSNLGVAERQAVKGWDFKSESGAAAATSSSLPAPSPVARDTLCCCSGYGPGADALLDIPFCINATYTFPAAKWEWASHLSAGWSGDVVLRIGRWGLVLDDSLGFHSPNSHCGISHATI